MEPHRSITMLYINSASIGIWLSIKAVRRTLDSTLPVQMNLLLIAIVCLISWPVIFLACQMTISSQYSVSLRGVPSGQPGGWMSRLVSGGHVRSMHRKMQVSFSCPVKFPSWASSPCLQKKTGTAKTGMPPGRIQSVNLNSLFPQ